MQPHDLIKMNGRTWKLQGVHLGGLGQESIYALTSLDRSAADIHGIGMQVMTVPCVMLDALCDSGLAEHYRMLNVDVVLEARDKFKIQRIREEFGGKEGGRA